jgi:dihydroxyacetone kinase
MPHIVSNPDTFVDDALEGFARAHADTVRRVDGGVVRATPMSEGHVALVIGGGSGHYPAFAGTVGEGLAAGAVCGQVFTSPSAGAAYRVAKEAHAGGGVIFSFGNYAGDVIHFGEAERRLRDEGIDCRTVLVTDDVASAPASEASKRRGIAGDFVVFKLGGAAAAEGLGIDEVERIMRKANAATFTMGVAWDGCTLPGADAPLFHVPEGMMSVGLGIHGEPGVRDEPTPPVEDLAAALIGPLLAERPAGTDGRVGIIVNGLGTVKYEELFVLFKHVWDQLTEARLSIVVSECGELVTSLDMAGASLTITWLDDELARLWQAPAYTPAYRRGAVTPAARDSRGAKPAPQADAARAGSGPESTHTAALTDAERGANHVIVTALEAAHDVVDREHIALGDLDAIAGDGDHGTGMLRGVTAALTHARHHADDTPPDRLLADAGEAWSETAGGTSGALWGAMLAALGKHVKDSPWDTRAAGIAAAAAAAAVTDMGKASVGDKTMVDAIAPYVDVMLENADVPLPQALAAAALAATQAATATASLTPKLGRARPLAERSIGHPDPGATSFALIVTALAQSEAVNP